MAEPIPSPALFFETINAFQRTEALRSAIDLDLFTLCAQGNQTAASLAAATKTSARGVRILADVRLLFSGESLSSC